MWAAFDRACHKLWRKIFFLSRRYTRYEEAKKRGASDSEFEKTSCFSPPPPPLTSASAWNVVKFSCNYFSLSSFFSQRPPLPPCAVHRHRHPLLARIQHTKVRRVHGEYLPTCYTSFHISVIKLEKKDISDFLPLHTEKNILLMHCRRYV